MREDMGMLNQRNLEMIPKNKKEKRERSDEGEREGNASSRHGIRKDEIAEGD